MKDNFFLSSERLAFRPYQEADAELLHQWFNDPIVTYYLETGLRPQTLEQIRQTIHKELESPASVVFMIVAKDKGLTIGIIGLYAINEVARKAEMRIIIGNQNYWNKGLGAEALELISFYGFDRLNLNKIHLGVSSGNEGAKKAYLKAGYVQGGVLKQDVYRNGQYYDGINLAMLREDYLKGRYEEHKN